MVLIPHNSACSRTPSLYLINFSLAVNGHPIFLSFFFLNIYVYVYVCLCICYMYACICVGVFDILENFMMCMNDGLNVIISITFY